MSSIETRENFFAKTPQMNCLVSESDLKFENRIIYSQKYGRNVLREILSGLPLEVQEGTEPEIRDGILCYKKPCPALTRASAASFFEFANRGIEEIVLPSKNERDPQNQIVFLPKSDDLSVPMMEDFRKQKRNFAYIEGEQWGDKEWDVRVKGLENKPIYDLVAQISSEADLLKVAAVANYLKIHTGAKVVRAVISYLYGSRNDKTVDFGGQTTDQIPMIEPIMKILAQDVDLAVVIGAHSQTAQYCGAKEGLPVASITQDRFLANWIKDNSLGENGEKVEFDPSKHVVIGPDEGRNENAKKIAKLLGVEYVPMNKIRDGLKTISKVDPKYAYLLDAKRGIIIDDEIGTFSTLKSTCDELDQYGTKDYICAATHIKGSNGWKNNIPDCVKQIIITDSRSPIGEIKGDPRIVQVSINNEVINIITALEDKVNFFKDEKWSSITQ